MRALLVLALNVAVTALQYPLPVSIQVRESSHFISRSSSRLHFRTAGPVKLKCCEAMNPRGKGNFEAEMCKNLEMSFRSVWFRIFTTGADIALKDFVKNAVSAYDAGYSLPALILELGRNEKETGHPNIDKAERFSDQERQTREIWLVLIYRTLDSLNYKPQSAAIRPSPPAHALALGSFVDGTCAALKAGFSPAALRLELSLRESGQPLSPAQLALWSQWTTIVFLTSEVIKFQPNDFP